jgi:hypothetical protein
MPVPEGKAGAREILAALGCFAVAFLATAAVIHVSIRNPLYLHADMRSEKLQMMKDWHGKVFSAVFGSSRLHEGFDPGVFDSTLAGSPLATHSANFAVEGGSQSEQRVMALEFVKQLESPAEAGAPPQPCFVLLEIGAGANLLNIHLVHPRSIDIYDWPTLQLITHFVSPEMSARQRIGRVGFALIAAALHYANVGMLSNAIFAPPIDPARMATQTAGDRRGQDPMADTPADLHLMDSMIAARPPSPRLTPAVITPGSYELISQIAAASAIKHLSFAYIEMPLLTDLSHAQIFPDHLSVQTVDGTVQVPIIDLARPDLFPKLYTPVLWHDPGHLSDRGADVISALIAQQLKLWYAVHGLPPACGG